MHQLAVHTSPGAQRREVAVCHPLLAQHQPHPHAHARLAASSGAGPTLNPISSKAVRRMAAFSL